MSLVLQALMANLINKMDARAIQKLGDIFGNLTNAANQLKGNLTTLGFVLAAVVIVAGGIGLSFGTQINQASKRLIIWAAIGVAVICLALAIISWVQNAVGGGF